VVAVSFQGLPETLLYAYPRLKEIMAGQ